MTIPGGGLSVRCQGEDYQYDARGRIITTIQHYCVGKLNNEIGLGKKNYIIFFANFAVYAVHFMEFASLEMSVRISIYSGLYFRSL